VSAVQQRHLLEVIQGEIDKIPDASRAVDYSKHLQEHLITVLAFEREHRTRGTSIKANITGQVEALAKSLLDANWHPGGTE
jgi:hypothetical protein